MSESGGERERESPARRGAALTLALWFTALAVFAVVTRAPLLREGLWRDEAISVVVASAPGLPELLERNRVSDYNPPLFNLLLAGYVRVAGTGETALKLLALGIGLLAAAATTALAFELGGALAGALTGALAVNNPLLIEMSTEVRAYSLSLLLAALGLLVAFRLRRRGSARGFVGLAALLTLLVYSHVAGVIVAGVLLAWGILESSRGSSRPFGRRLTITVLAAGATFLLWFPTTWRQFRVGIPWATPMTATEKVASLLHRTTEILPIPGGFGEPLCLIGIAGLAAAAVLFRAPVAARFRGDSAGLLVPSAAGGAVWISLGLFSSHTRYLVIPAGFASVVLSIVVARVAAGVPKTSPVARRAAFAALGALIVAAFWARRDLYEARWASAARPKSGIRTLCRTEPPGPADLVLVAPDYLAPTVWYYCGRRDDLRGFARWNRPHLFDPSDHGAAWRDPAAPARTMAALEREIAEGRARRVLLIREQAPAGLLPFYQPAADELDAALVRRFAAGSPERFPGRVEYVEAVALTPR